MLPPLKLSSLKARLLGAFVLLSVLPLSVVGVFVYHQGEDALRIRSFDHLNTVALLKSQQIEAWVKERRNDVTRPASIPTFQRSVVTLLKQEGHAEGQAASQELRQIMERIRIAGELTEVFLLEPHQGRVLISTDPDQEGKFKKDRPYFREGQKGPFIQHIYYSIPLGKPVMAFSAPVLDPQGRLAAILVGRVDLRFLDRLMAERSGLGSSGRTFLVNRFNYFVSESLGRGHYGWKPVFSEGVKRALAGQTGTGLYLDHEKRPVVGAYRWLSDLGLALIAEVDHDEAFSSIRKFRIALIVAVTLVCGVAILLGVGFSYGISRPVTQLVEAARAIGGGDLTHRVEVKHPDELATLASAVNLMAEDLLRSRRELEDYSQTLEARVEERTRELSVLLTIAQTVGSTLDLVEVLRRVSRELAKLLNTDTVGAVMVDPDGIALHSVVGYHVPKELLDGFRAFPIPLKGHRFLEEAWESKKPVFSSAAAADPRIDPETLRRFPHRSLLFVPLVVQGAPIGGLIAFWWEREHRFTPEELRLVEGVADQAATVVANARLYEASQEQARELAALHDVATTLTSTLDLTDVLEAIADSAVKLMGAQQCAVFELDPLDQRLHARVTRGMRPDVPIMLPKLGQGATGTAALTRQPFFSSDVNHDPLPMFDEVAEETGTTLRDVFRYHRLRAVLSVPLVSKETVFGALTIFWEAVHSYDEQEVRLLTALSRHAAVAIENARLYEETRRRTKKLETVARLTRQITAATEPQEGFDFIAQSVVELLDATLVRVWVMDEKLPGEMVVRSSHGVDKSIEATLTSHPRIQLGQGLIGRIAQSREIEFIPDVREDLRWLNQDLVGALGLGSFAGIPLLVGEKVAGVLSVLMSPHRALGSDEKDLLKIFADQAAIAIENARLLQELRGRRARLEALLEVSRQFSRIQTLESLLASISEACGHLVNADSVGFRLVEGDDLVLSGRWGDVKETMASSRLKIGESLTGIVAATGEPLLVTDPANDPRLIPAHQEGYRRLGIQTFLGLPVKVGDRVAGVLSMHTKQEQGFSREDLVTVTAFASQAAVALENARLYGDLARKNTHLQALFETARRATESLNLSDILPQLVKSATELIGADASSIRLLDPSGTLLEAVAHYGLSETSADRRPLKVGEGVSGRVVQDGQPVIIEDLERDHRIFYREQARAENLRAMAAVPLRFRDRIIGVLSVYSRAPRHYDDQDVDLLAQFGNVAAIAIENARLLQELRGRQARLEALLEVSRQFSRIQPLESLLQTIAEACGHLLNAHSVGFRLVEGDDLVLFCTWGDVTETIASPRLKIGESLAGIVAATGEPLLVTDPASDPRLIPAYRDAYRRLGIRAYLGVPVKVGDQLVGLLSVRTKQEQGFSREDLAIATAFASHAAIGLENARLYQRAEARAEKLTALSTLTRLITSAPDSGEVFRAVAKAATILLGAKMAHVSVDDPEARVLRVQASFGLDPKLEQEVTHLAVVPYGKGIVGSVFVSRTPEYLLDIQQDPRLLNQRLAQEADLHAFAGLPLITGDKVVGVLSVLFGERRQFTPEEEELMELLADQAVIAIERARLFEELRESAGRLEGKNQELEAFVYTVTHDLRAPLVAMQGMAAMLGETKGAQLDAEGQHYLERLISNTAHMEGLIRDLLEFSRIGRLRHPPEAVASAEVVDELLLQWAEPIRAKGVKVSCHDLPVLWGERTRIVQVFSNLLGNALKFLGEGNPGPTIEVGAEDRGAEWECYVKDNGIGIDPAYHGKVFELFERLREVEAEGTGVGLAIVKKIVGLAGGRVWVESEVGKGATFRFTWPKVFREGSGDTHE